VSEYSEFKYCRKEMHGNIIQKTFKGRDHLGDVGVDRRIILKWILKK
jgi:hypothetical protein